MKNHGFFLYLGIQLEKCTKEKIIQVLQDAEMSPGLALSYKSNLCVIFPQWQGRTLGRPAASFFCILRTGKILSVFRRIFCTIRLACLF